MMKDWSVKICRTLAVFLGSQMINVTQNEFRLNSLEFEDDKLARSRTIKSSHFLKS